MTDSERFACETHGADVAEQIKSWSSKKLLSWTQRVQARHWVLYLSAAEEIGIGAVASASEADLRRLVVFMGSQLRSSGKTLASF